MTPQLPNYFTIRPILGYLSLAGILVLLLWYIAFQARFIIAGPTIALITENHASPERTVVLEGQARNIVQITLNGRTIYTDERGYFKETVVLENGYTMATVEAKDRYGRTTTVNRSFVYTPITDTTSNNS